MSIYELVDIFEKLKISETEYESEIISKIVNPALRDLMDYFNIPFDKRI